MEGFKGTPGPWTADKTSRAVGPISRDDDQSYGMVIPVAWVEFDQEVEIQESNQNLIAAAPELLEALQRCEEILSEIPLEVRHVEDLLYSRAAINKALGETK